MIGRAQLATVEHDEQVKHHEVQFARQQLADMEAELVARERQKRLAIAAVKVQQTAIARHRHKWRQAGIDL